MSGPCPAEVWIPMFLDSFTPEQILKPEYMFSRTSVGRSMCKLCDALVPAGESDDDHRRAHKKELQDYGRKKKAAAERARNAKAEERRKEKELEREVLGLSALPEAKRLRNRVTSARYKLVHPEKHGREEWTAKERTAIQAVLDAAIAAVEVYDAKEEA